MFTINNNLLVNESYAGESLKNMIMAEGVFHYRKEAPVHTGKPMTISTYVDDTTLDMVECGSVGFNSNGVLSSFKLGNFCEKIRGLERSGDSGSIVINENRYGIHFNKNRITGTLSVNGEKNKFMRVARNDFLVVPVEIDFKYERNTGYPHPSYAVDSSIEAIYGHPTEYVIGYEYDEMTKLISMVIKKKTKSNSPIGHFNNLMSYSRRNHKVTKYTNKACATSFDIYNYGTIRESIYNFFNGTTVRAMYPVNDYEDLTVYVSDAVTNEEYTISFTYMNAMCTGIYIKSKTNGKKIYSIA